MALLELLAGSPVLFIILTVLLGLMVGSFLNVVIYRLPLMMEREWRTQCAELINQPDPEGDRPPLTLWGPRSQCPSCGHLIQAVENIPLLSYALQRGRCAHCRAAIGIQYPLMEALSGILAGIVAWKLGFGWPALAALVFTWTLLAASAIDFRHQLLPDNLTLPLLWLGLGVALFGLFTDLPDAVIGAMAGYLALWSVYQLFRLLTGKEGMGHGDFKLLAALGAWTGWPYLVTIILLSSLVGAIFGLVLILFRGRDRQIPMPFGPFLAAAGWIVLLWGEAINHAYLNWLGF
ncbi:MAG: prepilin peptidase [Candidatus Competibacteraceae bacterium]|uniref:Prepilin leader peptidase/N-methyltransferase n=1 Tax=Candidatus Contendobacter odensis Run_B_J11 TaxID=1400861 RepID=A0A7U7GAQ7_9GAMM|nr:A24 family peptidase [Candidatus Contendobacter odensis]MBK8533927.1 prepilin peptidase [Candidatus Competibacteraceae bacterium]MBK8751218.1 prepilin peptidase [Candidatus Competibacteraceae bacterium]CDH44288.1 type 4 prepilin-like proteins leader peptide processing enzyme (Protein secretion protein XCPA)(Includes: Leader peptidase (Prepilin peptidase); N-methyltransferase) [Candidatus Contendobacter odensis Run_B_J11]